MWFAHQDKIYHAVAYFIMGLVAWRSFKHLTDSPIILALLSIAFCSLYHQGWCVCRKPVGNWRGVGVSDEWHQSFVEGRFSDIADWIADSSGAGLAILLMGLNGLNTETNTIE